eukprot:scaffold133264_cov122-Phaeocystis_antarctica.AAC.1
MVRVKVSSSRPQWPMEHLCLCLCVCVAPAFAVVMCWHVRYIDPKLEGGIDCGPVARYHPKLFGAGDRGRSCA